MLKLTDADGNELDSNFSIERTPSGLNLVLESRGGSDHGPKSSRNKDYARALPLLLRRMSGLGMMLEDVQLASSTVGAIPPELRHLELHGYAYPIELSTVSDLAQLRLEIMRRAAAFGRPPGIPGGNPSKRLRLCVSWSGARGQPAAELEDLLAAQAGEAEGTQLLADRVQAALSRLRARTEPSASPSGTRRPTRIPGTAERFVRDADVIAWVIRGAGGKCEVCDRDAPFCRRDGEPFLEVHHMRPLADGGPDTVDNAIASCPNCHRELHHGIEAAALRRKVLAKLAGRLTAY